MQAYHIRQWNDLYETNDTRKIRTLTYYAKSNKLVGEGIGFTLEQPDNVALLGTWALIEALASTSAREYRGWLIRNGTALTAERMAALTRVDAKHFTRALEHFCREEVGWLERAELPESLSLGLTGGKPSGESPDTKSPGGKPSGESPDKKPPGGKPSGESPDNPPPLADSTENAGTVLPREREGERDLRENRERGPSARVPADAVIPSLTEVLTWAGQSGVAPDYAEAKWHATTEDNGWVRNGRLIEWRSKWLRFWNEDRDTWKAKRKKNAPRGAATMNGPPDGWEKGDADWWWTDPLDIVQATLAGAVGSSDPKTAARLRQILEVRKKQA